ncbi:MAG TPA: pitrilysin family protein [Bryobacteraceae bacterium]|nr:pitrilysin family protein [Bryobacteraceae bacterium]
MNRVTLALLLTGFCALAQTPSVTKLPKLNFTDTTLDNGLRVIVSEDHYAPMYAIVVSYKVGSRDERQGRTGFAHLFEHMMFQGSENIAKGELDYLTFTTGGSSNGTTDNERTLYFEVFPKNQLDLGLYMEADRMRGLNITQENLDNQRQAVKEERRLRVDNQPYGQSGEKLDEMLYDNFAYHHSVIGSMADLDAASVADVKAFFKTYYAPNNAVIALVGDLNTKEAIAKAKKYFGSIPRQDPPAKLDLAESPKDAERRATVDDKLARLTRLTVAYRIPNFGDPDSRALAVAAAILGQGQSSRLYQTVVQEKELASQISAFTDRRAGPGSFEVSAMIRPGKSASDVESLIEEEISKMYSSPVTDKELTRVRSTLRRGSIGRLGSDLGRAEMLADYAALYNDPNVVNSEIPAEINITAADIQNAMRKYLTQKNRVVLITQPARGAARGGRGQ